MNILQFTLGGRTAFFKKPDVNAYCYFTYGNIHKIALLGMFGAILGYGGYNQMKLQSGNKKEKNKSNEQIYPEFYERLKDMKVSIIPENRNNSGGVFPKKMQVFNNSVGYASGEQGGNLVVKEQWMENPRWDICFEINSKETEELAQCLLEQRCIFIPYLGKNDHAAEIEKVQCYNGIEHLQHFSTIDSLCPKKDLTLAYDDNEEREDGEDQDYKEIFKYEEKLPVGLNEITNNYEMESFVFTNMNVQGYGEKVYVVNGKNIVFY